MSELAYSRWAQPRPEKKLTPSQLRRSVDRLSATRYDRIRPHSAPPRPTVAPGQAPADPNATASAAAPGPTPTMTDWGTGTFYGFGLQTTPAKKLTSTEQSEMVQRLYTVKELPPIPEKNCVKLKYSFNPGARGGAGGFEEKWVPVKVYNDQESVDALLELRKRTDEKIVKLNKKLHDKYMQPLVKTKLVKPEEMEEFKEKVELLYQGKGTVKKN